MNQLSVLFIFVCLGINCEFAKCAKNEMFRERVEIYSSNYYGHRLNKIMVAYVLLSLSLLFHILLSVCFTLVTSFVFFTILH